MNEKPFVITISQSKSLLLYLILIHAVMLATIISLVNTIALSLIAVIILSISFIMYGQRYQWIKSNKSIVKIARDGDNHWQLYYADGSATEKLELKHCVVTPQLTLLSFAGMPFWRGISVTIMADALDAELFRQLRVYLRDIKTFQQ